MTLNEFQQLVVEVVSSLPVEFAEQLKNVDIVAEAWPTEDDLRSVRAGHGTVLFGLYRGVPHTKRGNYNAALPDKIAIFAGPIINTFRNMVEIRKQIRSTVLHEIGHHFGMSEDQIRTAELIRARKKS